MQVNSSNQRLLVVTTLGLGGTACVAKFFLGLLAGFSVIANYEQADTMVLNAPVPHVLVRPITLVDKPGTGKYIATEESPIPPAFTIPRTDVAKFLVDAVEDTQWDGK